MQAVDLQYSTHRVAHRSTAEQMQVKMENGLVGIQTAVYDQPESGLIDTIICC